MKSFSRQVGELFSFAGYKSNAKWVPCALSYLPHKTSPRLTYKCDIAIQVYEHYKKHGFKFSEKGVTPIEIAEEVVLYVYKSKDYSVSIDSFGYLLITPSEHYYSKLMERIKGENAIRNQEVIVENLEKESWRGFERRVIFFEMYPLTLSSLRMAYMFHLLKRKTLLLQEYTPQRILEVVDAQNLSEDDIKLLLDLKIVDHSTLTINASSDLSEMIPLASLSNFQSLNLGPKDSIHTASLRHNIIPFQHKYRNISRNMQVFPFGEIFPNLNIKQVQRLNPNSIQEILAHSLSYKNETPINLKHSTTQHLSLELQQQLKNRSNPQKLLILLDYLQDDRLIDVLSIAKTNSELVKEEPLNILFDQLRMMI